MKTIEDVAAAFAKNCTDCNPEAKNCEGLICTAVVYGANHLVDSLTKNLDFGQAIHHLKSGRKVRRRGWNGKGMFLWLKYPAKIKSEWCKDPMLKAIVDNAGGEVTALGTICMLTAQGEILSGWLASQTDILSCDWETVE